MPAYLDDREEGLSHEDTPSPLLQKVLDRITDMRRDGSLDIMIYSLAKGGDICKALGHNWVHTNSADDSERKCSLCGRTQTREWI